MAPAPSRTHDVWAVEQALNAPPMGGIRVGGMLNDLLLRLAAGRHSNPAADLARLALALRTPPRPDGPGVPALRGRVLVTLVDGSARITDLVLPVVEALGAHAAVLVAHPELATLTPSSATTVVDSAFAVPGTHRQWWRQVRRAAPTWMRSLRRLVADGSLARRDLPAVLHLLLVQTQRAVRYADALAANPPAAVLVEYDRGAFAAPLVAAARSLGIPTATMVHGALSPVGYTPPLAELVTCWGEAQVDLLERLGVERDQMVVTGCPRLGRVPVDPAAVRRRLGLDERPLVVLATNNLLPPDGRLQLAEVFLAAIEPLADRVQVGLRTHPREHPSDYDAVLAGRRFVRPLDPDRVTLDEVLAVTDLVVCGATAFADDALISGVPSVLLEPATDAPIPTVGLGADGPHASDTGELGKILAQWLDDPAWRAEISQLTEERGRRLCAWQGDEAAARVADAVRRLADGDRADVTDATPPSPRPVARAANGSGR